MKDDLKKYVLDSGLAKDRERWKAKVLRKTSDMRERGPGTSNEEKDL